MQIGRKAAQRNGARLTLRPSFILSGCDAHGAFEVADEMALVIETHHFGDMGQGHALAQQGAASAPCAGGSGRYAAAGRTVL